MIALSWLLLGCLYPATSTRAEVVISEIMYHPASQLVADQYLELHNTGAEPAALAGWRFTGGVAYDFPSNAVIAAGGYLVVAADVAAFAARYPGVTNVVGNWTGTLGFSRNDLDLDDATGRRADTVSYADEGDWAVRMRGYPSPLPTSVYRGWTWFKEADGLGKSLELINPALPNQHGQNWAPSLAAGGTPGGPNSVAATNVAPLILEVNHRPLAPRSADPVSISARLLDETATGLAATLYYRLDGVSPPPFTSAAMLDDGAHGDGAAGDGIYGAVIPAQPAGSILEFYVAAADAGGRTRAWPAPAIETNGVSLGQVCNALYQVDDTVYTNAQPVYRLILKAAEWTELAAIQNGTYAGWPSAPGTSQSDAQMSGTFLSLDAAGADCRYRVGLKNRGHGTRNRKPNNFRVNFCSDQPWHGVGALNLNGQYSHAQIFGAALLQSAGVAGADSQAVRVRVNGADLTTVNPDRTYGCYAANEVVNGDWVERHFPDDPRANLYRVLRDITPYELDYRGESPLNYTNTYFKRSNAAENDWSDLIAMLRVLGLSGTEPFTPDNVRRVADVDQWLRHLAVMAIVGNAETGLNGGYNDDYILYCGVNDPRFRLIYYDLDSIVGITSQAANSSLFGCTNNRGSGRVMERLLNVPEFRQAYLLTLQDLVNTTFAAPQYNALLDRQLGGYVPASVITTMKTWMGTRRDYVNTVVAANLGAVTNLPVATLTGEPRGRTPRTAATLTVGGTGVTHYRCQLDGGAWGLETAVGQPITLSGLAPGPHRVAVLGREAGGLWQAETRPTLSTGWTVDPQWPGVRLNEVLARNVAATNWHGKYPDLVELYNEGSTPVDLAGLRLSDDPLDPDKFVFPAGTTLGAGEYLVLVAGAPDGTPGLHLGLALNQEGDGLYLFDRAADGGALLDQVAFGLQLADYSVGRVGSGGAFTLTAPTPGAANRAQPLGQPTALKLNEWLAAPASPYPADFVELFNPEPLPVALGGLHLTDTLIGAPARHPIAPLSFIAAGGYTVFQADGQPGQGASHLGFQLAAEGGQIGLYSAGLALLDSVIYSVQSGNISEGRCPNGAWNFRAFELPTPGLPNACPVTPPTPEVVTLITASNLWHFQTNAVADDAWRTEGFDDSAWPTGEGLLFEPPSRTYTLPYPWLTLLPAATRVTYYFRAHFQVPAAASYTALEFRHVVDDGAVFYLNGREIGRHNLPTGAITADILATSVNDALEVGPVSVALTNLHPGDNVLAVELHQNSATSADLCFGLILQGLVITNTAAQAGVLINEILANNTSLAEPDGRTPDWVELFNPSATTVDLAGLSLSDSPVDPRRWVFPDGALLPGGARRRIFFDAGQPASATNTGFGLKATGDSVYLFNRPGEEPQIRDAVFFGLQTPDYSVARVPDGSNTWGLAFASPAGPNQATPLGPVSGLRVNEWMAAPAGGDDWLEIFNPGSLPVALGGLWLTDNLNDRQRHRVPALSFLGAGSNAWQRFTATGQPTAQADEVSFAFKSAGEAVGLSTADGGLIDGVAFGPQTPGVSEGRLPDGGGTVVMFPGTDSPGDMNWLPYGGVRISEVLTHTDPPLEDAIELQNVAPVPLDLGGWWLSDAKNSPRKYRLEPDTVLGPGGFRVFYENQFNRMESAEIPFALSSAKGDEVWLSATDTNGALTGYRVRVRFGPAANGVSFGAHATSQGLHFVPQVRRTFGVDVPPTVESFRTGTGLTNAGPLIGPVVLSEIMYHPPDVGTNDNPTNEFIEVFNLGRTPQPLFDTNHPAHVWRLRGAVDFDFATNQWLPPGGTLVVVGFDPVGDGAARARFEAAHGTNLPLAGPWLGKLDNRTEEVRLLRPDAPEPDGEVPYLLVESVTYADALPWPASADGQGLSLHRFPLAAYADDPVHWQALVPTPGLTLLSDTDGDGLPDDWELAHGLDPRSADDAAGDADGDGLSNAREFLAGTDPQAATSTLAGSVLRADPGWLSFEFAAVAGRSYSVLYTTNLWGGPWRKLVDVPPRTNPGRQAVLEPILPGERYYRVVTPMLPAE